MPLIPQLILSLAPSGEILCEAPGLNGHRRKIQLLPGAEIAQIRAELQDQADRHARIMSSVDLAHARFDLAVVRKIAAAKAEGVKTTSSMKSVRVAEAAETYF